MLRPRSYHSNITILLLSSLTGFPSQFHCLPDRPELPRSGRPLAPEAIATALRLPVECVVGLLDDLEKRKLFLFRNPEGEVAWAYPVTVDATPHHFAFESGERLKAA